MVFGQHVGPKCIWETSYRGRLRVNISRFSNPSRTHMTPGLVISIYDPIMRIFHALSHLDTCSPLFMMINTKMNLGKVTVLSKNLRQAWQIGKEHITSLNRLIFVAGSIQRRVDRLYKDVFGSMPYELVRVFSFHCLLRRSCPFLMYWQMLVSASHNTWSS